MKTQQKLFAIIFSFSIVLVGSIVFFMQWSINKGMVEYVNKQQVISLQPVVVALTNTYQQTNSWQVLAHKHRKFQALLRQNIQDVELSPPPPRSQFNELPQDRFNTRPRPKQTRFSHPEDKTPPRFMRDRLFQSIGPPLSPPKPRISYALLDENKRFIVGNYPKGLPFSYTPIMSENEIVGYFAVSKQKKLMEGYEFDFVKQQQAYLGFIGLALLVVVLLLVLPLARHLLLPLRQLTHGVHQLTQGKFNQAIKVKRNDEFGDLSKDFNHLAKTLAENEQQRKRWLANISHELRTPVAILRGELEAVIDGVRSLSMATISSVHQETLHLQKLIDDLHELTSADIGGMSYYPEPLNLAEIISNEFKKYQSFLTDAGLSGEIICSEEKSVIMADKTRLCQLLENLIHNTIKYAGKGCKVKLSLSKNAGDNQAILIVEDNGKGVDEHHLANLFEHLYRTDDSRNRETGGSGLGLAICAHIVKQHQGDIYAERSSLGGLKIVIKFPLISDISVPQNKAT